jgi:hypothetical protein
VTDDLDAGSARAIRVDTGPFGRLSTRREALRVKILQGGGTEPDTFLRRIPT